jgi:hypothetical protein
MDFNESSAVRQIPDRIACRWCTREMIRTVLIPPLARSKGMAVFRCEQCNRLETKFIAPFNGPATPH